MHKKVERLNVILENLEYKQSTSIFIQTKKHIACFKTQNYVKKNNSFCS